MVSGGIVREIMITNPDAGTFTFYGIEGETWTYVLGGYINADDPQVDGAGNLLVQKQRVPGSIDGTVSSDMADALPALEYCQKVCASLNESTVTFENTNGEIYGGSGAVIGNPSLDGGKSSFALKIMAGRGFTKQ